MFNSIFNILSPQKRTQINRLKRVMLEGSPHYHYDVGVIAATASIDISISDTFPKAQKYAPLDTCRIINNGAVGISLTFNSRDVYVIPAGVIQTITRDEIPAIYTVRIININALLATVAGLIDIDFWKSPEDADSVARRG